LMCTRDQRIQSSSKATTSFRILHMLESSTQQVARKSTDHPSTSWNFKAFIHLQSFRPVWALGQAPVRAG
jgi:hypothetical protein